MITSRPAPRPRADRLARNDEAILDAALEIASTSGWGDLTAAGIARATGLSKRPVLERHRTRSDLAVAVWTERCEPALLSAVRAVVEPDGPADRVPALLRFARPSAALRAAAELVTMAQFDDALQAAVARTADGLRRSIGRGVHSDADAARRAYAVSLAFGLLWLNRSLGAGGPNLRHELDRILTAIDAGGEPVDLPEVPVEHLRLDVFDTGDAVKDALQTAALSVVGEVGFEAATTSRIAHQAQVSEGALFNRFPSKLALFVESTQQHAQISLAANAEFITDAAARYGQGVAEAATIQVFMRPERRLLQALNLEQLRVGWHDPILRRTTKQEFTAHVRTVLAPVVPADRDATAYAYVGLAMGTGVVVTALLVPEAWDLPYDVVTVPLEG